LRSHVQHIQRKIQAAAAHEGIRRYFFNTGWMFAEKGLRLVAGLFIGAYVARYLGPSQYGLYNYVVSLVFLFSMISLLGLDSVLVRELVKNEARRDELMGTAFAMKCISATVVLLVLVFFVETTESDPLTRSLIYIIAAGMLCETFGVIDFFFQAKIWSKYTVWSQMVALASVSIFRIVLVMNHASLKWFVMTNALDLFILSLGLIYFYRKKSFSIRAWRVNWKLARELLKLSWPFMFSSLAIGVYMRIDQIMIKWMLGDEANGNYGVAVRLGELWNFIPMAICGSVFPAILNAKMISEELYLKRLQWLYDLMVGLSVAIAIPMTFMSGWIIRLLFGDAYSDAGDVLALYIWSSVFTFLGVANGKWIISENLQIFLMISLLSACVINIVLNYILIKTIGINGAAISTLISYAFAVYFSFLFQKRTRPMFWALTRSFNLFRIVKELLKKD
jgi:O-antigen/teichoic acid export membrane protein